MRLKRMMSDLFRQQVVQPTADILTLHRQGQLAQSRLLKFGNALAAEIGSEFELGQLKSLARCFEKVAKKYDGDATRLHDVARGTEKIDSISQIYAVDRAINPDRQSDFLARWAEHGYFVRDYENKFESPSEAGFRSIDIKLEVPLSHGNYHIAEIQVLHTGMEEAYAKSHAIMEAQRSMDIFDPCAKDIPLDLAANFAAVTMARREIHDAAAHKLGLRVLEKTGIDQARIPSRSMPKFDRAA